MQIVDVKIYAVCCHKAPLYTYRSSTNFRVTRFPFTCPRTK